MKFALTITLAALLMACPLMAADDADVFNSPTVSDVKPAPAGDGKTPDAQNPAPAEGENGEKPAEGQEGEQGPGGLLGGMGFPLLLIGMLVLMFVLSSRGRKKEQKRRQQMLNEMKKGDKVVTIGGIVGTAIEVRDLEVVVQIAEGARVKFLRSAIARVGDDAKEEEVKEQESK